MTGFRSNAISAGLIFTSLLMAGGCSSSSETPGQLPPFPWRFEKISDLDTGNEEALLGGYMKTGLTVDAHGRVSIVTDVLEGVHRFTPDGQWLDNLGRKGQGPGEFQYVFGITASPEGELLINDNALYRLTHLSENGFYIRSIPIRVYPAWKRSMAFAGPDRYWILHSDLDSPDEYLLLMDSNGDTLHTLTERNSTARLPIPVGGTILRVINPASHDLKWTSDDEGSAWVLTADRNFLLHCPSDGSTQDSIRTALAPLNLTEEEWVNYLDVLIGEIITNPRFSEFEAAIRKAIDDCRSDLHPVQDMWWVDENGILVDRRVTTISSRSEGTGKYAAILPDGRMTAEVTGPPGIEYAAYGYAIQIESDWNELPMVTLYRLEPIGF